MYIIVMENFVSDMVMTQHLVWLHFIGHVFSHCSKLLRLSLNLLQSLGIWVDLYRMQSSANKSIMLFLMSGRSFINIRKELVLI